MGSGGERRGRELRSRRGRTRRGRRRVGGRWRRLSARRYPRERRRRCGNRDRCTTSDVLGTTDATASDVVTTPDANPDTGAEGDASSGGDGATLDAADASDACGSVEICNNGIDDNCNGLIDCANPDAARHGHAPLRRSPRGGQSSSTWRTRARRARRGTELAATSSRGGHGAPATCSCTCAVTTPGSVRDRLVPGLRRRLDRGLPEQSVRDEPGERRRVLAGRSNYHPLWGRSCRMQIPWATPRALAPPTPG